MHITLLKTNRLMVYKSAKVYTDLRGAQNQW